MIRLPWQHSGATGVSPVPRCQHGRHARGTHRSQLDNARDGNVGQRRGVRQIASPTRRFVRGFTCPARVAILLIGLAAMPLGAQEPTALEAAATLEQAFVDAIARAERSVVAIARYRQDPLAPDGSGEGPFPFAPGRSAREASAPNEFAAGVVIDRRGYILTNYHVLGDPTQNAYKVWVNRRPIWAVTVQPVPLPVCSHW